MLGIYIFVAVPFPMTGVWTGSAIATFLNIPFFKSMMMVWLGNLTAGLIVMVLSIFLKDYVGIILDVFFIIVIAVLLLYVLRLVLKMVKEKKAKKQAENITQDSSEEKENNAKDSAVVTENQAEKEIGEATKQSETDNSEQSQNSDNNHITAKTCENNKKEE